MQGIAARLVLGIAFARQVRGCGQVLSLPRYLVVRVLDRDNFSETSCSNTLNFCESGRTTGGQICSRRSGPAAAIGYDELNAPLGEDPVRERSSRGKAIVLAGFLAGGNLALAFAPFVPSVSEQNRPPAPASTGADFPRPARAVATDPAPGAGPDRTPVLSLWLEEGETRPPLRLPLAGTSAGRAETAAESADAQSGVKIIHGGGAAAPAPLIIDVAKALGVQAVAASDSGVIDEP